MHELFNLIRLYVILTFGSLIASVLITLNARNQQISQIQYENIETQQYLEQETEQETD